MKSCSRCGEWKSSAAFYVCRRTDASGYPRSRDGRHHECKDCQRERARLRARASYEPRGTMSQRRDEFGRFAA